MVRRVCPGILAVLCMWASPAFAVRSLLDPHKIVIEVKPGDDLAGKVASARPGTTLLLRNGVYRIDRTLVFRKPDVWIRSKSGSRDKVILDGHNAGRPMKPLRREDCVGEIIAVRASMVTIADVTIRYARDHGIHVFPGETGPIANTVMHNIHVYDCGQQLIKVNGYGRKTRFWADRGVLEDSLVEFVDNSIMQKTGNSFYTGGIDVHGGRRWWIRRNTFRNIQREAKIMEHAIHMWSRSRGTVVEENRFINCYRAVGFGMKVKGWGHNRRYMDRKGKEGPYFDHLEGTIRNNFIFNRGGIHLESGIELMNVLDVEVYHNTVVSRDKPFSSIEYRWPNTRVKIFNNIVSHNIMRRDGAQAALKANIEKAPESMFADCAGGDLHLSVKAKNAIDRGVTRDSMIAHEHSAKHDHTKDEHAKNGQPCTVPGCKDPNCVHHQIRHAVTTRIEAQAPLVDIDGEKRDEHPDIGADEYSRKRIRSRR